MIHEELNKAEPKLRYEITQTDTEKLLTIWYSGRIFRYKRNQEKLMNAVLELDQKVGPNRIDVILD